MITDVLDLTRSFSRPDTLVIAMSWRYVRPFRATLGANQLWEASNNKLPLTQDSGSVRRRTDRPTVVIGDKQISSLNTTDTVPSNRTKILRSE